MKGIIMRIGINIAPRRIGTGGFSLIELMIVIGVVMVMVVIAAPSYIQWQQNLRYRDTARDVASMLREGRARAISTNREYRVELLIGGGQFRLTRGNSSSGSGVWTEVRAWQTNPAGVNFAQGSGGLCPSGADVNVEFNPNGTAINPDGSTNDITLCVQDDGGANRYQLAITPRTGRIRMN
jgi:Tfp pilus assembly protein FimT